MLFRSVAAAGGVAAGAAAPDAWLPAVQDVAPDDRLRGLITELAVEPLRQGRGREVDELYAQQFLVRLRQQAVDRRIQEVRSYLQRLGPGADQEALGPVQNELWALQQYAQALRVQGAQAL